VKSPNQGGGSEVVLYLLLRPKKNRFASNAHVNFTFALDSQEQEGTVLTLLRELGRPIREV